MLSFVIILIINSSEGIQQMKICPHYNKIVQSTQKFAHLKPSLMNGWFCLKDACFRFDNIQQFALQTQKLQNQHKVFVNVSTLEIYCFGCSRQLLDDEHESIYQLRKNLVQEDPEQQKTLYAGHKQYPPAFHKQKEGMCGLVGKEINSYVNAVIQLFAHVTPFSQILASLNAESLHNQTLSLLSEIIMKIRSGKFRIIQTVEIEKSILNSNSHFNFSNYGKKSPAAFVYSILKIMVDELQYSGPDCYMEVIQTLPLEEQPTPLKIKKPYSPMHCLFSGSFHWQSRCNKCKNMKVIENDFECIRLECQHMKKVENIHLDDLIDYTFDLKENNPFTNKKCEKCKEFLTLVEKQCYMSLPNLLLLQFSSLDNSKVTLPPQLNLTKYSNTSEKEFLYDYVGSIGKMKKKYITHVIHNDRQYMFDDAIIKDDGERPTNIKIAVYKLDPLLKNKNIYKNIQSSLQVNVNCNIPLPDFWHFYVGHLRNVQPLANPFICQHGYLKPNIQSKCSKVYKLPYEIYEYLVEQFGGMRLIAKNDDQFCPTCEKRLNLIKEIKESEKEMAKFADQLSGKKHKVCIQIQWLNKWKKYLYEESTVPYNNEGNRRPGQINNKKGLDQNSEVIEEKYKKVSPEVWYFFKRFYGGGPLIAKTVSQPNLAAVEAINLRYENIKQRIQFLNAHQY